jgi:regulatory protein
LSETGLLDDQAFSRFWVEARQNSRPRGKLALRSELLRKGIDRATINETLAEQGDANDERERAEALARSVLHKYNRGTDKHSFQRRLGGFLQRRGFAPDIVIGLVGQLWREIQTNAEEE